MIHKITYQHTHYYLIPSNNGFLAFDAGWPCSFSGYRDAVKQAGLSFKGIRNVMVSHFHMDHAGLVGQFVQNGVPVTVFDNQTGLTKR